MRSRPPSRLVSFQALRFWMIHHRDCGNDRGKVQMESDKFLVQIILPKRWRYSNAALMSLNVAPLPVCALRRSPTSFSFSPPHINWTSVADFLSFYSLDSIPIRASWHAAMLYIKSSESINMCNVIHDAAGWYYASVSFVSKIRGALWVHVQGYLYSKRLLPCRSVAMEEPHIVFEADRCSLTTGRSPFSLFLQPESGSRGSCLPCHKK